MSDLQNAGQNRSFLIVSVSFENVVQFKYFVTTVTNQNTLGAD